MDNYKLIVFDIDGTLVEMGTRNLLPGVADWFKAHGHDQRIALCTNQGGVCLKAWMMSGGFGNPSQLPSEDDARQHIKGVQELLPTPTRAYVCFAYQSKKSGKWGPLPPDVAEDDPEWDQQCRKPAPGMLFRAIKDAGCTRADTLFVGDGMEDLTAADNADVAFMWADDFFGRK